MAQHSDYAQFLAEFKKQSFEEVRSDTDELFECVVGKKDMPLITGSLETFFGVPAKPLGQAPGKDHEKYTAPFGGIRANQALYYKNTNGCSRICMIWPWNDGARATFKIYKI